MGGRDFRQRKQHVQRTCAGREQVTFERLKGSCVLNRVGERGVKLKRKAGAELQSLGGHK